MRCKIVQLGKFGLIAELHCFPIDSSFNSADTIEQAFQVTRLFEYTTLTVPFAVSTLEFPPFFPSIRHRYWIVKVCQACI